MIRAIFRPPQPRLSKGLCLQFEDSHNWCFWQDDQTQTIEILNDSGSPVPAQTRIWMSLHAGQPDSLKHLGRAVDSGAHTIVLRGATGPEDVEKMSVQLTVCEIEKSVPSDSIQIVATFADTARAVQNLSNWSFVPERLAGFLFDPLTLARSMGLSSVFTPDGTLNPLLGTARHLGLFAGKALDLPVWDGTPRPALANATDHYWDTLQTGFAGAVTESPDEIALIAEIFR